MWVNQKVEIAIVSIFTVQHRTKHAHVSDAVAECDTANFIAVLL